MPICTDYQIDRIAFKIVDSADGESRLYTKITMRIKEHDKMIKRKYEYLMPPGEYRLSITYPGTNCNARYRVDFESVPRRIAEVEE